MLTQMLIGTRIYNMGHWKCLFLVASLTILISVQVNCIDYCGIYQHNCNGTTPVIKSNVVYCINDGTKLHGVCEYFEALCQHNVTLIATGVNCEHKIVHHTPRPVTQMETNLYHNIIKNIDGRLEQSKAKGITPAKAKSVFSTQDHTNKVYIRNTDCWAYDLDLTPISPWNSNGRTRKAGTLVSKRHMLWARHYSMPVGTTIRFVTLNNTVVERKVAATKLVNHSSHGKESFFGRDIVVAVLDKDVPDTISFAKVMPRDIIEFRPSFTSRLPVLSTDFEEHAIVTDFSFYSNKNIGLRVPATGSLEHEYYEKKIGGDSGNPSFFIINDELILLFVFTTGGAGGGTSINHYYDEINELMKAEGGGYQLTPVDLTKFDVAGQHIPHILG